jgi:nitrite reductase (NADH) large subunit
MGASHKATFRQYLLLSLGCMRSTSNVVVVGHGTVGHRFVEALRSRDADGAWRVTVLAEESDAAYDRVGLTGSGSRCRPRGDRIDYDALVLATGSYPFVPPVPGHDLPAWHVYRTLDDLDAIRADALRAVDGGRAPAGVVIGGGLLGLEAANALRQFGLETHVVEMAPRLMAQQLDEAGGALLSRMITELGSRRRHREYPARTTQSTRPAVRRQRLGAGDAERREVHRRRRGRFRGGCASPRRACPQRWVGDRRPRRRADRPVLCHIGSHIYAVGR